jgi:hypothetical protein
VWDINVGGIIERKSNFVAQNSVDDELRPCDQSIIKGISKDLARFTLR